MDNEFIESSINKLFHWQLGKYRSDYENGNNLCLLDAMGLCINYGVLPPDWVVQGFNKGMRKFVDYEEKNLSDAFNIHHPKGKHLSALRKKKELEISVYIQVVEQNKNGAPIDEALFSQVGEEFGIGKTLASEYYYSAKNLVYSHLRERIKLLHS